MITQKFTCDGESLNGHSFIDLGLDTLWSECNLGSRVPVVGGDYLAWGETAPKNEYSWFTYAFEPKDRNLYKVLEELDDVTEIGFVRYDCFDSKIHLDPVDDAATFSWGNPWRIPSADDFKAWLTSRINGNHLFLPAAGYKYYDDLDGNGCLRESGSVGAYQSADRNIETPLEARYLYFDSTRQALRYVTREIGLNVRPVFSRSALNRTE